LEDADVGLSKEIGATRYQHMAEEVGKCEVSKQQIWGCPIFRQTHVEPQSQASNRVSLSGRRGHKALDDNLHGQSKQQSHHDIAFFWSFGRVKVRWVASFEGDPDMSKYVFHRDLSSLQSAGAIYTAHPAFAAERERTLNSLRLGKDVDGLVPQEKQLDALRLDECDRW